MKQCPPATAAFCCKLISYYRSALLVRSEDLPLAELLEELSIDPVSTLSEDSFTSDEQLKRCIDLSYKYLSPVGQSCFLFAPMFPGSFDCKANKYYCKLNWKHVLIKTASGSIVGRVQCSY